ncbi:MAG: lipoprotein-releasing ABC transporter ATP-binding protein LolD [Pseudomonadales bacterium]|nr:lipoprotein-releasing ABC transporter ATP-binding protein LolD [Pseudomonadales bacterium]
MTESLVLECVALNKEFTEGPEPVRVLKDIELRVKQGERISIVGNSGSGKTTLLNLLGGLDLPSSGYVKVAGENLNHLNGNQRGRLRNRHIGFIYQFHHLLPEFDALENVAMPLLIRGDSRGVAKKQSEELLEAVGLGHRLRHKPSELSGGERQRVAIARALVTKPSCVLADEPTGNLDSHTAQTILDIMSELNQRFNISFVTVTHSHSMAVMAQRILEMEDGRLKEIDREML